MASVHPLDRVAALANRALPRRLQIFRDGWGEDLERFLPLNGNLSEPEPLDLSWHVTKASDGLITRHATFLSREPALPEPARQGHLLHVGPLDGHDTVLVIMAAWNDHDYTTRWRLAVELAVHGVASVIPENPFYGRRRVVPDQAISTVVDFALMTGGAVSEARSLLTTFEPDAAQLGVTGYSMGGSLAALVGATAPVPVRCAPLAASYSPAPVFLDGAIAGAVAWDAIGDRERLREVLSTASLLVFPPPPEASSAVLVGAERDGFVPRAATEAIHDHWRGSELRWEDAGHASLMYRRLDTLTTAVVDALA